MERKLLHVAWSNRSSNNQHLMRNLVMKVYLHHLNAGKDLLQHPLFLFDSGKEMVSKSTHEFLRR